MIQILQAVIPYLVGMHSKHKETVLSSMDLTDKVIVDLDEDSIVCNQDVKNLSFLKISKRIFFAVHLPAKIRSRPHHA